MSPLRFENWREGTERNETIERLGVRCISHTLKSWVFVWLWCRSTADYCSRETVNSRNITCLRNVFKSWIYMRFISIHFNNLNIDLNYRPVVRYDTSLQKNYKNCVLCELFQCSCSVCKQINCVTQIQWSVFPIAIDRVKEIEKRSKLLFFSYRTKIDWPRYIKNTEERLSFKWQPELSVKQRFHLRIRGELKSNCVLKRLVEAKFDVTFNASKEHLIRFFNYIPFKWGTYWRKTPSYSP